MARGSIRKRGERSWQIVYDAPRGADGNLRQQYETIQGTKRQARLSDILAQVNRGKCVEPSTPSIGEFQDQFLRDYAEVNRGAGS